jgi:simple sugar transport system substrate-binding protein
MLITCHLDAPKAVIETAEARGVKTCGHAFDQARLAPKGYITSAEYHWIDMFETFIETLQKGGNLPNFVTGGYDKDYVRSSPFGPGATPEAINAAKTAIQAMKNGDAIFVGPIIDNAGKPAVPAGTTYGPYPTSLCRRITWSRELLDRSPDPYPPRASHNRIARITANTGFRPADGRLAALPSSRRHPL